MPRAESGAVPSGAAGVGGEKVSIICKVSVCRLAAGEDE